MKHLLNEYPLIAYIYRRFSVLVCRFYQKTFKQKPAAVTLVLVFRLIYIFYGYQKNHYILLLCECSAKIVSVTRETG